MRHVRSSAVRALVRLTLCAPAVALALGAQACRDDADPASDATPAVIRTANDQAKDTVLDGDVVGEGWSAVPNDTANPNIPGAEAIVDRAFQSWASCVGNQLAGGFVGLGRLAVVSSPRFTDGTRIVAGAVAVFIEDARLDEALSNLKQTSDICGELGESFRVELEELPAAPADAAASYRMAVTLEARGGNYSDTFDMVVLRQGLALETVLFKGFGANEDGQADILARAATKLDPN
jgi:hypothetical protein